LSIDFQLLSSRSEHTGCLETQLKDYPEEAWRSSLLELAGLCFQALPSGVAAAYFSLSVLCHLSLWVWCMLHLICPAFVPFQEAKKHPWLQRWTRR
jgi:hypothetical protein